MEQEKISQIPVCEDDKKAETSYGKFHSAEELLKAYSALESEFTKRSQKLKELEAKQAGDQKASEVKKFMERYPVAERFAEELTEEIAKGADASKGLEGALLNVLSRNVKTADEMAKDEKVISKVLGDEENKEHVISGYLDRIRENSSFKSLPKGGAIPVAPCYRPKSIREAGEIAKKILERIDSI